MIHKIHNSRKTFFTPERVAQEQAQRMESSRGKLLIAGCCSGAYLSTQVVESYNQLLTEADSQDTVLYLPNVDFRFSDTETCARLELHVGGYDVFLIQALLNPLVERSVDENYMAFLIAARTFRDHGANHVTAVLPYLAYARQDKPTKFMREPTTAKLMADLSVAAGIDRLVTWEPHSSQMRGFYDRMPVEMLDALTLFSEEFRQFRGREDVIVVAPDAGASKFVTYFGRALDLKCAIASKFRPRPEEAHITEVIGDFAGKRVAIVLDDMISSGGTIYELVKKLVKEKGIREVYLGASHNLCMQPAYERLLELHANYSLKELVVTNSIPQTGPFSELPFVSVRCLSETLSRTINRIHYNHSVSELFYG
jgi:ribose-phosphate pyrophosphokinase